MTLIPDGITPLSGWRVWGFDGATLRSLNGTAWEPMKPMKAECGNNVQQQLAQVTVSMLKQAMLALIPQGGYVGTGPTYHQVQPLPVKSLTEAYNNARFNMLRPNAHAVLRTIPLISVYDEDTGERFIPFGQQSRIVLTADFAPPEPPPSQSPVEGCSCGIYAAGSRKRAEGYMGQPFVPGMTYTSGITDPLNRGATILGRVALWGKVIVHEDGYRAEYAYPQSFFTDHKVPALEAFGAVIVPLKDVDKPLPPPKRDSSWFGGLLAS